MLILTNKDTGKEFYYMLNLRGPFLITKKLNDVIKLSGGTFNLTI